jgi:putative ABC transport system permease protein
VRSLRRKLRRDLRRQLAQFSAVAVVIFLGVTLFVASYDSYRNLEASYEQTAIDFEFANITTSGGDVDSLATMVSGLPGVAEVATRSSADVPLRVDGVKLLGRVVGVPADGEPEVNRLRLVEGELLDPDVPGTVLVEEHMASHFDLVPGSVIEVLRGPDFVDLPEFVEMRVAGIVSSPEYIWPARSRQELLVTPDNFGVVFADSLWVAGLGAARPEMVAYFEGAEPDEAREMAIATTALALGAGNVYTRAEQPSNAALQEDLKGFEELSLFFPLLFLSAAAMAGYVMINRLVYAQRPEIGLLLANGFTRRQVLRHVLGYGLVPALAGAIPGAILGSVLGRIVTGLYIELLSVPVELVRFAPDTIVLAVMLAVVVMLLAAIGPALSASRMSPAQAMRSAAPAGRGKPSVAERIVPPLRRLPIRWRMALRSIERSPRRTFNTILGIVMSLTLVLVSWGMLDSMNHLLTRQFVEIQREDARVRFVEGVAPEQARRLDWIDGVAVGEPAILDIPIAVSFGAQRYVTVAHALEPDTQMHGFYGTLTSLPDEGLLVGRALEGKLGIAVGDMVQVSLLGIDLPTRSFQVAGFVDEPMGTVVYVSLYAINGAEDQFAPVSDALIRYDEGASYEAVRAAVTDNEMVAAFEDSNAVFRVVERYMGFFDLFVGVMLAFGAAMAFALIFNTMSVNLAERSREVATLLAVGTDRRSINRLLVAENMVVALAGVVPGLAVGYFVSAQAMASFETDLFSFELNMKPSTLVLSAVAILAVAALSQFPALRALNRIEVADVVRERSV